MLMAVALTWRENIFVGCMVTPTSFSVDNFLSDSFHCNKKQKILYVGSFNYFATVHMRSNCYITTGVRD